MSCRARNKMNKLQQGFSRTVEAAPLLLRGRLSRPMARRGITHLVFEGGTAACGRRGWSKVPRVTREHDAVTCADCRRVVEKLAGGAR